MFIKQHLKKKKDLGVCLLGNPAVDREFLCPFPASAAWYWGQASWFCSLCSFSIDQGWIVHKRRTSLAHRLAKRWAISWVHVRLSSKMTFPSRFEPILQKGLTYVMKVVLSGWPWTNHFHSLCLSLWLCERSGRLPSLLSVRDSKMAISVPKDGVVPLVFAYKIINKNICFLIWNSILCARSVVG